MGLGNPGETYAKNRHNVGFIFVDWLLNELTTSYKLPATSFSYDKFSDADIVKIQHPTSNFQLPTLLAKPRTFMNKSGFTANKLATSYQLPATSLIVIHDDLDIKLGEFKIQQGKGPKVHNGLSSIESSLRFKDFWRVRIGIDNRDRFAGTGEEYVLGNFTKDENEILKNTFPIIFERLEQILQDIESHPAEH